MSRRDEPYSVLYWKLADEYPEVWDDDRALAWYARLLKAADAAWPSAPDTPAAIPNRTWKMLVGAGLVIPEAGGRRYRIRGVDKRREARMTSARIGADHRWRNADRTAVVVHSDMQSDSDRNAFGMPHSTAQHSTADIPQTPRSGATDGSPRERGVNPRAMGTNPRAIAAREELARREAWENSPTFRAIQDLDREYRERAMTLEEYQERRDAIMRGSPPSGPTPSPATLSPDDPNHVESDAA